MSFWSFLFGEQAEPVSFACEGVEVMTPADARVAGLLGGGDSCPNACEERFVGYAMVEPAQVNRGDLPNSVLPGLTNREYVQMFSGGYAAQAIYGDSVPPPPAEVMAFHELCSGFGAGGSVNV